jgi:predicted Rossmann fold flavoprotein
LQGKYKIVIIGAGAAGLMAAIAAAEKYPGQVLLLEKGSRAGRKILISGGGRCNVTNNKHLNLRDFLANYPRGAKFLWGALSRFSKQDTIDWFEKHGLKLKTEDDGRVFPVSNSSEDVMEILLAQCKSKGVKLKLNTSVSEVIFEDNKAVALLVDGSEKITGFESLIITCGGMAYQKTGSSGDAYKWSLKAGHKVSNPKPSLLGFVFEKLSIKDLQGLAFKELELSFVANNKKLFTETEAAVFTHWGDFGGISGPVAFRISSLTAGFDYLNNQCFLQLNFFPALSRNDLEKQLKTQWQGNSKRKLINCLQSFVTERLQNFLMDCIQKQEFLTRHEIEEINLNKTCSEISKKELNLILDLLTAFKIPILGIRPSGEEIVTAGGVVLDEVCSKTMKSKLITNLYWAGEVLDLDGFTGGYNLQAAWSTGFVAGSSI